MATSVGEAAARGLESGFSMGLRLDAQAEEKRARAFQEGRQLESDRRADEDLKLRRERDVREERRLTDAERRDRTDRAYRYAKERQNELVSAASKSREAGGPIPEDVVAEYGRNAQTLARVRQDALNYFSRLQTGEVDMESTDPGELYMNFTAATGRRPEEAPQMKQSVQDVQTGLETGNQGLLLQGINGVMAPQLKKGLGSESPYGGKIVRKEIIGLDPARDGQGRDHPDKFIPRLRVYVEKDGKTQFYDAPVTKNRSTDPDDPVVAVSIDKALDTLGNFGVLMAAMDHPEIQAKLAEGSKAKGGEAQRYLDELYAASTPTKKGLIQSTVDLGDRVEITERDAQGKVVSKRTEKKGAAPKVFPPSRAGSGGSAATVRIKLDALKEDLDDGLITDDEYAEQRKAILSGIKPGAGSGKGPSNAEQNAVIRDAENAAATKLGLKYDATTKTYRTMEGNRSASAEQLDALSKARDAAAVAVRNAAAKKERVTGDDVTKIATEATKAPPASQFEKGKTYTNAKGQKAKFGGVDPQGKNIWLAP